MNRLLTLTLLMLAAAAAGAAEEKPQPAPERQDLEQRLEAARERLDEAAREVAELSAQLGAPIVERFRMFGGDASRPAMLGVQVDPASGRDGVRVEEVSPGGPAEEAGVRAGDVIVAIDGTDLRGREDSARELIRRMGDIDPDSKVKLRVMRDGKPRDLEVIARARARAFRALPLPPGAPDAPGVPGVRVPFEHGFDWGFFEPFRGGIGGMELASLTLKLGAYFGTDKGVLVVRAPRSGELSLEDGDVILSIDRREPRNGSHAMRILRSYQPGEKLSLRIMRQRKPLTLTVTLPARDEERQRA